MCQWKKSNAIVLLILALLPPTIIAALRYYVGTDSVTYMHIFERVKDHNLSELFQTADSEGGFSLLIKIASYFGGREWFYGLSAFLVLLPAALAFKKDFKDYSIGLMWFLFLISTYVNSLNIIRQSIAIALVLYSAKYLFGCNLKKFVITIFVACLFHFSAIIFLPCYWLRNSIKFFDKRQLIILGLLLVALINMSIFFNLDTEVETINKYSRYIQENDRANNREFFFNLAFCLVFVFNRNKLQRLDTRANLCLFFSVLAVAIGFTGFMTPYVKRIAFYFSIFNIPLSCMLVKSANKGGRIFMLTVVLTYYVGKFIVMNYILGQANLFPYNTESTFRQQFHFSCNETTISNPDIIRWRSGESSAQSGEELA
jgi:hypothetical protein